MNLYVPCSHIHLLWQSSILSYFRAFDRVISVFSADLPSTAWLSCTVAVQSHNVAVKHKQNKNLGNNTADGTMHKQIDFTCLPWSKHTVFILFV